MPKTFKSAAIIFFTTLLVTITLLAYASDKCDSISNLDERNTCLEKEKQSVSQKLNDVLAQEQAIAKQITTFASQLNITQSQLDDLNAQIATLQKQLNEINKNLEDQRIKLADKITLRNYLIRNYMKRTQLSTVELFFASGAGGLDLNGFGYSYLSQMLNKAANQKTLVLIGGLNSSIAGFEKDKADAEQIQKDLTAQQNKMVALKKQLDAQKASAQNQYQNLNQQEKSFSQKLADLNAKQQEILKLKNGDSYGTVGDYSPPGSSTPNPTFSPAFGAFSYGAFTHYNGLSQYGAKGRAEAGKKYKDILKFYYGVATTSTTKDKDATISVSGYGTMTYQKYLYGIAEMPSTWPSDALKAQAVAARSYAYRSGKPICTTDSCQVFSKSKSDNPPSAWKKAVDDTSGEILKNPQTAQYSSTTGGYINNIGWDIASKWPNDAYEKKAGSPWFYKAWYTKGYNSTDSCGKSGPWLTQKEMADILNSWVVWRKGSGSEKSHISPITTKCWGGDPYSLDEMAGKADNYGENYTSVSSVDVSISNGGYTSSVKIGTNHGTITIDGNEFKTVFNLRAPGYISIKSRLFDLEKR